MTDYVEFKTIEKYPDMSPAEFREKLKKFKDISDGLDKLQDEFYNQAQVMKVIHMKLALRQIELKAAIYSGLIEEDNKKYIEIKEELVKKQGVLND